jgi:hypothetical protein
MRGKLGVGLAVAVVCVGIMGATRLLAASSQPAGVGQLAAQVADLKRRLKLQGVLDLQYTQEILALQNRKLQVSSLGGTPAFVPPGTWGHGTAGPCINGVLVAGGFSTNYPAYMGTSQMSGYGGIGSTWDVHVLNPSTASQSILLSTNAVCLSLSP